MNPSEHAAKVAAAVELLREVALDDLREGEGCEDVLSNVRVDPDFYGPGRSDTVGDCEHGTVVAWITGNAQNARDAIVTLTGRPVEGA